jgi:hypothetical protein
MPCQVRQLDVPHSKPSQPIIHILHRDATQKTQCTITYILTCLISMYEKLGYVLCYKSVSPTTYESSRFVSSCGAAEILTAWFKGSNWRWPADEVYPAPLTAVIGLAICTSLYCNYKHKQTRITQYHWTLKLMYVLYLYGKAKLN